MQNYLIAQTVLAELQIPAAATGQTYEFKDVPELRKEFVKVYGIIVHSANQDYVTSTNGNPILGTTELQQVLFTISNKDAKYPIYNEPAISFVPGNNGGFIRFASPIDIDIMKCYIKLTGTTSIANNDVFAVSFIYDYFNR